MTTLLRIPSCHVFALPAPPPTRAADWDDARLLWDGGLRIVDASALNSTISILLEGNDGVLFAECPYSHQSAVQQVVDSSRYFILKIVDKITTKHAFIGLGFPDRSAAFDFNVALQEAWNAQTAGLASTAAATTGFIGDVSGIGPGVISSAVKTKPPKRDYSLKDGELINIALGSGLSSKPTQINNDAKENASAKYLIAPPVTLPPPSRSAKSGAPLGSGTLPPSATKTDPAPGTWTTF